MRPGFMHRMRREGAAVRWRDLDGEARSFLWTLIRPHWPTIAASSALLVVGLALALLPPLLTRTIVDGHLTKTLATAWTLDGLAVALIAVAAASWLCDGLRHWLSVRMGQGIVATIRSHLTTTVFAQPPAYRNREGLGTLVSIVVGDVDALSNFASTGVANIIGDSLTLLGCLLAMWWLAPPLTVAVLPVFPLMICGLMVMGGYFRRAARREREAEAALVSGAEEGISAARVVQSVAAEDRSTNRFAGLSTKASAAKVRSSSYFATILPLLSVSAAIATALVLAAGASHVAAGQVTVGVIVAFLWYLRILFGPLRELSLVSQVLASAAASLERVYRVYATPPLLSFPDDEATDHLEGTGGLIDSDQVEENAPLNQGARLTVAGLSFAYGAQLVLDGIDLDLPPGANCYLVGPSGAGKTTLAWCAARLADPSEGAVHIDGIDIRSLSRRKLRQTVVIVPQEVFLFPGTVMDNLSLAWPGKSIDELEAALEAVGMASLADRSVGEGGRLLSGGQRRLVSLARALPSPAPVIVLDEPLAGVDAAMAAEIRQQLAGIANGRTVLIATHRLHELLVDDSFVACLDEGRLVGRGTTRELRETCPSFRQLWQTSGNGHRE